MVLVLVITAGSLAVVLLGFGLCRLSALSDRRHAVELADWIASCAVLEQGIGFVEPHREQLSFDFLGEAYSATG